MCTFSWVYRSIIESSRFLKNARFFKILIRIASFKNTLTFTFEHGFFYASINLEESSDELYQFEFVNDVEPQKILKKKEKTKQK